MTETLPNAAILALTFACVVITAWNCFRSLPFTMNRSLRQAVDVALDAKRTAEQVQSTWAEEKLRIEGVLGALEDLRDQIEKKRARTVAAERRQLQVEEPQTTEDLKMQLRRSAGLV